MEKGNFFRLDKRTERAGYAMMKWCLIPERFPYLYMKSKVRKSRHVRVTGNLRWRTGVGRVKEGERVVTLDGYRYLHFPLLFLLSPLPKQVRPMFEAKNKEKKQLKGQQKSDQFHDQLIIKFLLRHANNFDMKLSLFPGLPTVKRLIYWT